MSYFSIKNPFFIPSYGIDEEEIAKIDKFLKLLERSGALELLNIEKDLSSEMGGRPSFNRYDLFAAILYCFTIGRGSLRDIEEQCKYDLRLIYITNNEQPKHSVIGRFINENILPNADLIFTKITTEICKECGIDPKDDFLDGTKLEADANKYGFVWNPEAYHKKLTLKVLELTKKYNMERGIQAGSMISSKEIAEKITELSAKENSEKDLKIMSEYLAKCLEYEEKERICGPGRNSYYKTDHDATAMCLKEDYYSGLGSNMHAGYNIQILVSKGIILTYFLSQSRHDSKDFIPTLEKHFKNYGWYPQNLCADAGYGSEANYKFLEEHNIGNYVKYVTWQGNVSGSNPSIYHLNEDNSITCLGQKTGNQVELPDRHPKKANGVFYKITGCQKCDFRFFCKRNMKIKSENFKIFEINPSLQRFIQQSETNLLSPKGIEMRVNRSAQVEGAFGVIKQDFSYERFRRTSISKVNLEFMLTSLGYNLRKLFSFYSGKAHFNYWVPPHNLENEKMKNPSFKRLTNKVNRKKKKSVNERSKEYKYK